MPEQKKLFLLDAYALIYRSYYAFIKNPRYNSKGFNTSAVFGFTMTMDEILRNENPSHIAVVFDTPSPTFRHKMYDDYKANREETPDVIKESIPVIKDIIRAFNINVVEFSGYEADDVIGTLAKRAEKEGFTTYMMTPDKDFCQLVSDNIFIYKPRKFGNDAEILGVEEIKKRFDIDSPEQVIDILALWGDSSDNIPGAMGIGEVNAKKLIKEFGNLEVLYNNLDKLKGKQKENLINSRDRVELAKNLVTIHKEVPLEIDLIQLKYTTPDKDKLGSLFSEMGFINLTKRIIEPIEKHVVPEDPVQTSFFGDNRNGEFEVQTNFENINTVEHKYYLVDTRDKCKDLITKLKKEKEFCFDTETTGINVHMVDLVGISFSINKKEAYYLPVPEKKEDTIELLQGFKEVFENPEITKIGQNIKYDILMLMKYGINTRGKLFDTMLAHYIIQPELRHNLKYLAEQYLNYTPVPIEQLIGKKGKDQKNMRSVPFEEIKDYAAEDADITFQLKDILEAELENTKMKELSAEIEMPLIYVLAEMEKTGITLNGEVLSNYAKRLHEQIEEVETRIIGLAGINFNISSPKQLGEILFDKLKISEQAKKTKSKQYSTGEEVLVKLADKHEIIPKILEFRSLKKLLSTYVDALPRLINPRTNKIHSTFNQAIVATGRLSSNNPNLQNIPIREARGKEIRTAFIPSDKNNWLVSADYSQIELRLMAHLSDDQNMIEAFLNNEDIHRATAAKIYGIHPDEVDKDKRGKAKTANFGIIYGISVFGLSQRLNIPRNESKILIDGYFNTYPKVKEYMDNSIALAREKEYVETIKGRRRYLEDINSRNAVIRGIAERNAINAPIQGSAADIIKIAMIKIHNKLIADNYQTRMILQVHDELVFDVPEQEIENVKTIIKTEMENAIQLKVPLTVDIGIGKNWLDAH